MDEKKLAQQQCPGCETYQPGTHKVEGDFLCDSHYSGYLFLSSIKEDDDSWQYIGPTY